MALFGWFKRLGKKLADLIVSFLKSDAVKALVKSAEGKIVSAVVAELDAENFAGDKRKEALKRIAERFAEAGLEFNESVSSLLLEIAVARLKSKLS